MRLLRTIAYWSRYILLPFSARWTTADDDAWRWECWRKDYRGTNGGDAS